MKIKTHKRAELKPFISFIIFIVIDDKFIELKVTK